MASEKTDSVEDLHGGTGTNVASPQKTFGIIENKNSNGSDLLFAEKLDF